MVCFCRSQLGFSQTEVSSLRAERERTATTQASVVEAMRQRLQRAESEIESIKREHQAQVSRLQGDNQLLASLHRVCLASSVEEIDLCLIYTVCCVGTN